MIETQDMNKLLCLGGCVTAIPITADVAILEVDDGRPFAGNYKDAGVGHPGRCPTPSTGVRGPT